FGCPRIWTLMLWVRSDRRRPITCSNLRQIKGCLETDIDFLHECRRNLADRLQDSPLPNRGQVNTFDKRSTVQSGACALGCARIDQYASRLRGIPEVTRDHRNNGIAEPLIVRVVLND